MSKLDDAREILKALQVPARQQSDLCCYVLLAMAGIKRKSTWSSAANDWIRIHEIIAFIRDNYGIPYAENSREAIRKQAIHHYRNAAFVEDNGLATNSSKYQYRLTDEMLLVLRAYNSREWKAELNRFSENHESLLELYRSKRNLLKTAVKINEKSFVFSPGKHNMLQKAIIEEFAPRFAPGAECLYVGDTVKKDLLKNESRLRELGFEITLHDKMPDVVFYSAEKNWLYFVEAVCSVGSMEPKRVKEIEEMTRHVKAGKIYVTAFPDFKTYKTFSAFLAWETEVWIAETPDHMIHLNGDKFLGPRK